MAAFLSFDSVFHACVSEVIHQVRRRNRIGVLKKGDITVRVDLSALSSGDHFIQLTTADIAEIARTYHAWRGEVKDGSYEDVPGYCKAATQDEIKLY